MIHSAMAKSVCSASSLAINSFALQSPRNLFTFLNPVNSTKMLH